MIKKYNNLNPYTPNQYFQTEAKQKHSFTAFTKFQPKQHAQCTTSKLICHKMFAYI